MSALTGRQIEVARLLAEGQDRKQIAFQLDISVHTVTQHIREIYGRTGVHNRASLVLSLLRAGIIQVDRDQGAA